MTRDPRRAVLPLLASTLVFAGLLAPASGSASTISAEGAPSPSAEGSEATARQLAEARRRARQEAQAGITTEAPPAPQSSSSGETESTPRHARGTGRRGSCHVSLEASPARLIAGATVTLSGKLQCAAAADLTAQPLVVFQRGRASGMSEVATTSTDADGSFQVADVTVDANTIFIARAPGGQRARVAVKVAPMVTLSGPSGAQLATRTGAGAAGARHNRFTFTGTVTPVAAGARVTLQREYGATDEQWHPIAFARVQEDGSFSVSHGFRTPGQVSVRVVVHPKGEIAGASEPLTYVIAQAQNPQLTIASSADPVASGQPVQITGVALGAPGQSVKLLARTPGHPFAPIAEASTDEAGAYQFTVSPLQSTTYRVSSATTISTPLFEAVKYDLTLATPPSGVAAGTPLTLTGTLLPAQPGQVVFLERENVSGTGFRLLDSAIVAADGSYSITHTFTRQGSWTLRVRVPADSESQGSTSAPFALAVSAPAAPAEAAPLVAAQS
jgi:hypothetical protein